MCSPSRIILASLLIAIVSIAISYLVATHPNDIDGPIISTYSSKALTEAILFGLKTKHEVYDDGDPATLATLFPVGHDSHQSFQLPTSELRAVDSLLRLGKFDAVKYDKDNEEQAERLSSKKAYKVNDYVIDIAAIRAQMEGQDIFLNSHLVPKQHMEPISIDGEYAVWVTYPGVDNSTKAKTIIYIHGGGAIAGSARQYTGLFYEISRAANARVLGIDYALAPEHPLPAGIDNTIAAYKLLVEDMGILPKDILIAGESGGGHVSLLTLQAIRDRGMKQPCGAWVISPQTDMTASFPSLLENTDRDAMISAPGYTELAILTVGGKDPTDPNCKCSAIHQSFEGLPPMFLQVAENEVLRDDGIAAYVKAKEAGVEVSIEIEPHVPHAYPIFVGLRAPEILEAFARGISFVRKQLDTSIQPDSYIEKLKVPK